MLAGSPISWQAKKQSIIALSTAEAEYAAFIQAAKEVIWLQNLLKDLGMTKYVPKIINVDNQGTIALAENPIYHTRTKHLDVQLQFVCNSIENGTIKLSYGPTDTMLAYVMTKALTKEKHATMQRLMGMKFDLATTTPLPIEDVCFGKQKVAGNNEWAGVTWRAARARFSGYFRVDLYVMENHLHTIQLLLTFRDNW